MKRTIDVPLALMAEVATIICDHELEHEITAGDQSNDTITMELTYEKGEREIIHEIEDLVEDHIEEG